MFRFAASSLPVTLRQMGLVAMACSIAALSACGGGNRAKAYQPDRIVSFGDENSLITSYQGGLKDSTGAAGHGTLQGLVYTINTTFRYEPLVCTDRTSPLGPCTSTGSATYNAANLSGTDYGVFVDAGGALASSSTVLTKIEHDTTDTSQQSTNTIYSCAASTIWVQVIAHNFGLGYKSQCPTDADGAVTYASFQATVTDVGNQVAAHRGELGKGVLVTLMVGQKDILDLYSEVQGNTRTQASAEAELQNRAGALANVVKDIISTGAKVVLALTPDLGQSPFAASGNQVLLARLTKVFNETLYITNLGTQAGRDLAGVNPEPFTNPTIRSTAYDYTTAACTATGGPDGTAEPVVGQRVKFCTTDTLVSTTTAYMWADNTHFAPVGHSLIGSAGYNRAYNQF